jgi:hypothetical protein
LPSPLSFVPIPVVRSTGAGTTPSTSRIALPPLSGIVEVEPNPADRPSLSAANLRWSTWLIANSTMNSTMSRVIMSA